MAEDRARTERRIAAVPGCIEQVWRIGVAVLLLVLSMGIREISGTDHEKKSTSDPVTFSTYLGGSGYDSVRDVAIDDQGNIYVAGGTESSDFPVTRGSYQTSLNEGGSLLRRMQQRLLGGKGRPDAFVVKLDPAGKIIWATFLGGPSYDRAYAIAVDRQGYVYVAGRAGEGFPVTSGAFQTSFLGGPSEGPYPPQSGFVAKITPDGRRLVYASYFGAGDSEIIRDIEVDGSGDVYIAASSVGGRYPQAVLDAFRRGVRATRPGGRDGVIAKIATDGSRVLWASYLGGSGAEWGQPSLALDADANVYFLTVTESSDATTTAGAYDRAYHGHGDFYLAKLTSDGSRLVYATYLGGSQIEHVETHQLAVDAQGNAYVAAATTSPDFPITPGAFQKTYGGSGGPGTGAQTNYPGDVIVAKLSSDGSRLLSSTFVGGRFGESAEGVGIDASSNVYFTGTTFSDNFPVSVDAFQATRRGQANFFAVKLSADFGRLLYGTYLGGTSGDAGRAAAVDGRGVFLVGGEVNSTDWPTRHATQATNGGRVDGGLVKLSLGAR
jgi:hypothetical protein